MDEFSLINQWFASLGRADDSVSLGIGDDCALVQPPAGYDLAISTDTLNSGVHFPQVHDPFDLASRALRVNVSDLAAMGATPRWASLALTLPEADMDWLSRFSAGLGDALRYFDMTLIGGDTTRGPLSMTLTVHGVVPAGKAVRRGGAQPGDIILISGYLGAAALALQHMEDTTLNPQDHADLMQAFWHPEPAVSLGPLLRDFATAAIDISDGLAADLYHICRASSLGACLARARIPVHPAVLRIAPGKSLEYALHGGDDYALCMTVPAVRQRAFTDALMRAGLVVYPVGTMKTGSGIHLMQEAGVAEPLEPRGYNHFREQP